MEDENLMPGLTGDMLDFENGDERKEYIDEDEHDEDIFSSDDDLFESDDTLFDDEKELE